MESKSAAKPNAVQQTLTRHERLLTVFGATLVLVSFFLKEDFREHSKDLASSLEATSRDQELIKRLEQVQTTLNLVQLKVRQQKPSAADQKPAERYLQELNQSSVEDFHVVAALKGELKSDNTIYAGLPFRSQELTDKRTAAMTAIGGAEARNSALGQQLAILTTTSELAEMAGQWDVKTNPPHDFLRRLSAVEIALNDFNILMVSKAEAILSCYTSEVEKEGEERLNAEKHRTTGLNYVLDLTFVIGWSMGLLGRLFKVASLDSGADD